MKTLNEILHESIRNILLENRESKNINLARKFLKSKGYNDENAQKILDAIRTDIPNSRLVQCKFLLGIVRLYLEKQLNDGSSIQKFNKLLSYIASETHLNEYDNNLNGMSLDDINNRFTSVMQQDSELSRKNSYSKQHVKNNDYNIVRIPDFETASKYSKYTSWCVTHSERMYNNYTHNGIGLFYFCLKNGFENVEKKQGENAPLDEYGLSMIAVSVDEEGEVSTITSRWNHDMKGNDHIMTKDELEDLLGVNFYETFKPYSEEELMKKGYVSIKKIKELLSKGQDIYEFFGTVKKMTEKLFLCTNDKEKFIIYNSEIKNIPDTLNQWLDYVYNFYENYARVEKGDKMSFINSEGNLIGDGKAWFDWVDAFSNGFAQVNINNKWSVINSEGNLIGDGNAWFDDVHKFYENYAIVEEGDKMSFINLEGKLIGNGNAWFDDVYNFCNGFARVKLDDKYSFIDTDGNLIGNGKYWFDDVDDFQNGFAKVKLNDEWFFIDKNGNLYNLETREKIMIKNNNESKMSDKNFKKIINENIKIILLEKESSNNSRLIPKRFISSLSKFNDEYKKIADYTESEYPMLDTSSGSGSFYKIENSTIENGVWNYTIIYDDFRNTTYNETINLVLYDDDYGEYYFNEEAKDYLSELKKDLKKGLKYFKEYNPSYDDNEAEKDNFLSNL